MRRHRIPRLTAIAVAAFAAVLIVPGSARQMSGSATGGAAHRSAAAAAATGPILLTAALRTGGASADASGEDADAATAAATAATAADVQAATGGLCSVPGIGDIGGLLGFCAAGSSGVIGALNNVCQPSLPDPEPANAGIDAMVTPPSSGKLPATLYDQYGVAGDYWAATNLQCSDMTSLIGNNVAGMVFDAAKSIDRVTITVYESAAGEGILSWLQRVTDRLITSLGNAIYFPYLAVVIILAAIWLAWQGLIRKRATRTIEGTVWMVVACAAAIFLIGKPADVTGIGRGVSDGISQALNVAFAKLPSPGPASCVPVQKGDPQVQPTTYSYTSGSTVVDQNADELWTVLVCKPWLVGEFGTSAYSTGSARPTVVNTYGRALLWSQAIAVDEHATPALIQAKQDAYAGIASSLQANDPAVYPLFQGKQWTTRLEVGFAALFAAAVAGILVLLISVTLILLKLSFLLLLIVGPFFLLIGTHPGFGRVVALRWVELLIGVLLKQAAIALVLSVLLYCYALIMGTSDAVLPWALKILMIALVTVAAFIYRKPFQHLFSAVGYGVIGSQDRAEAGLAKAGATARANTVAAATAVPPFAAYRVGRWARRNPAQAANLAMAAATSGGAAAVAAGLQAGDVASGAAVEGTAGDAAAAGPGSAASAAVASGVPAGDGTGRMALTARARAAAASAASSAEPPPLNLPARNGTVHSAAGHVSAGTGDSPPGGGSHPGAASPAGGNGLASAAAPGAWPLGRGVGSTIQGWLRPPADPPPRQASPPAAGSGGSGPSRAQSAGRPQRVRAQQAPPGQQARPQQARPQQARPQQARPQQARPQQAPAQQAPAQRARSQQAPAQQAPAQQAPAPRARPEQAGARRAVPQQGGERPPPARSQAPKSQPKPTQGQQSRGQAPASGRLRFRRSAGEAPQRPPADRQWADRQRADRQRTDRQPGGGQGPAPQTGQSRTGSGQQGSSPGQAAPWQGEPMTGPLSRPPAEPDSQVPFWLRPIRRK
jgi:hypothetical protein